MNKKLNSSRRSASRLLASLVVNGQEVVRDPGVGGLSDPRQPQVPQTSLQAALPCAEGDSKSLTLKITKKTKQKNTPALSNSDPRVQAPIKDSNTLLRVQSPRSFSNSPPSATSSAHRDALLIDCLQAIDVAQLLPHSVTRTSKQV